MQKIGESLELKKKKQKRTKEEKFWTAMKKISSRLRRALHSLSSWMKKKAR